MLQTVGDFIMIGVKYMIREYRSGKVVERSLFAVGNATKPRKGKKAGNTPPRKQDDNDKSAARHLARTINANYQPGDIWATLTYSPERYERLMQCIREDGKEPELNVIQEYAEHDRDKCVRRIKRDLAKKGIELKYVAATADIDGSTGEYVRIHHHLVLPKDAYDILLKHWSKTEVDLKPLKNQDDYTPVAEYIIKQVRRQPDKKKYTVSRNMVKPEIREKIVMVRKELTAPRGAKVMFRSEYDRERASQYIRYIDEPEKRKRGGKRE